MRSSGTIIVATSPIFEYGIPFDPELVSCTEGHSDNGFPCARHILSHHNRPTGLFWFNDRTAMGVYDAIRLLNLKIPQDVAVVGFDNQEIIAAHLYPALTTMGLPHYQMGVWAVQKLVEILSVAEQTQPVQHKMACPLIERDSA